MSVRLLVIGLSLGLSMPASTPQTIRGGAEDAGRLDILQSNIDPHPRRAFSQTILDPVSKKQIDLWARSDEPGAWIAWESSCDVTGPLLATWEQQLKAIAALVRACPVFRDIRGYYPWLVGCVDKPGGGIGQYGGTVHFLIWPPTTVERTATGEPRIKKEWKFNHPGGISLMFRVNAYGDMAFSWHHWEDKEGRFYELPETSREIGGFPVIGSFLFVSLPEKPPLFTPITQERAQRWIIDNMKRQADADASILASARRLYEDFVSPAGQARRAKTIEGAAASQKKPENQELERRQAVAIDQRREQDLKAAATPKPGSPAARTIERLSQLESRLASMSPDERRQPAWYKPHPEGVRRLDYGDIVEAGSPGARPLVVPNPGFFDKSLPKTAMQLVSIPWVDEVISNARKGGTAPTVRVPLAVLEQMDWRAVAAMLK
jgi:hypothetical protein